MAGAAIDVVELTRALVRCPSITPVDAGALDVLQETLAGLGFRCHRVPFTEPGTEPVDNLYARIGDAGPNFCFAGHTDVVPPGDLAAWRVDPFAAEIVDGVLYGRGSSDMKGAVAAFVGAADRFLRAPPSGFAGSVSLLITGDEEGPAVNGTRKVLGWMREAGERIDHCLVGEPTNPGRLGEMVKNGRRGSLSGRLTVRGVQGHVAYPHLADNPIPRLVCALARLTERRLDRGTEHFPPSNLEVTTVDVGNEASNLIPAEATARFNIRFNTEHSAASLQRWIGEACAAAGEHELEIRVSGDPFLTTPGPFTELICQAVAEVTGGEPELSTTGGTSDARFIKDHCPVAEFGLVGETIHKVDERVVLADLDGLSRIYERILKLYFA